MLGKALPHNVHALVVTTGCNAMTYRCMLLLPSLAGPLGVCCTAGPCWQRSTKIRAKAMPAAGLPKSGTDWMR